MSEEALWEEKMRVLLQALGVKNVPEFMGQGLVGDYRRLGEAIRDRFSHLLDERAIHIELLNRTAR